MEEEVKAEKMIDNGRKKKKKREKEREREREREKKKRVSVKGWEERRERDKLTFI